MTETRDTTKTDVSTAGHTETPPASPLARYLPAPLGESHVTVQRRTLLSAAMATVGLTVGGPLLVASTKTPSLLETHDSAGNVLEAAEREILDAAHGHMLSTTEPADIHARALGVWRDVATIRHGGRSATVAHALYIEALAAALVADLYGNARLWDLARPWFNASHKAGKQSAELGEVRAPAALVVADCLAAKVVLYGHKGKTEPAERMASRAVDLAAHPHLGPAAPGRALAPSLLARARAMNGDRRGALEALDMAARWIEEPGYAAAPFNLFGPTPEGMSVFGYGERAHYFTTHEVHAYTGDVPAARQAGARYMGAPGARASTTSATSIKLGEARCMVHKGQIGDGAELAHRTLTKVKGEGKMNATITTRAVDLVDLMHTRLNGAVVPGPVDRLAAFVHRANMPASVSVDAAD